MVRRTYYGVISDALEACFSFEKGLDSDTYSVDTEIPAGEGLAQALGRAITIEGTIQKAYSDAATLSEGLMADLPRAFRTVAGKRADRIARLMKMNERL